MLNILRKTPQDGHVQELREKILLNAYRRKKKHSERIKKTISNKIIIIINIIHKFRSNWPVRRKPKRLLLHTRARRPTQAAVTTGYTAWLHHASARRRSPRKGANLHIHTSRDLSLTRKEHPSESSR